MFLDYAEPLLQLPYENDLSIAIFILKLFCNKFNFFDESYEDYHHIDRIKFRYYLQNTFKEEINNELDEYKTNFTNEVNYYGEMFNLTNFEEYNYYSSNYNGVEVDTFISPFSRIEKTNKIFKIKIPTYKSTYENIKIQIPTYENRILISKNFLDNMNLENIRELNKQFLNLWITNFEEKIDINNLDVINILRDTNYKRDQLVRIYEIVKQEIKKKYNLEKYEQLKNFLFQRRLSNFNRKDDVNKLMDSIMDIKKLNLNICHKQDKQVAVPYATGL